MTPQMTKPPLGGPGKTLAGETFKANNITPRRFNPELPAIDRLLPLLDRVKQTGPDQWMAAAPTRDERTPSLSIKRLDDRVLIYDFGGDDPATILAAIGLRLSDLFDRPLEHQRDPLAARAYKRQQQAREALEALVTELDVVLLAAEQVRDGFALDVDGHARLDLAANRIKAARRLAA